MPASDEPEVRPVSAVQKITSRSDRQVSHKQLNKKVSADTVHEDRSVQARVVDGELLDREIGAGATQQYAGFTMDGQFERHPGFYQRSVADPAAQQEYAIHLYNDTSRLGGAVDQRMRTIDLFV